MKSAESKQTSLVANLGDFNRPLRVRPVRYMGREWWAIDTDDIWPGIVMDLRRLGFESVAYGEDVLVRESTPGYEPMMIGPAAPNGLKPFPTLHPTIRVRKDAYLSGFTNLDKYSYYDAEDFEEDVEDESECEGLEVLDNQEEDN